MTRVVVCDYGAGNLLNMQRALEHLGAEPVIATDPAEIVRADRLVVPGVGAFGAAMAEMTARRLTKAIIDHADSGKPFLVPRQRPWDVLR